MNERGLLYDERQDCFEMHVGTTAMV
jgi:hypothetical protein